MDEPDVNRYMRLPPKYAEWRDSLFPRNVGLLDGIGSLTNEELKEAWRTLLPGLTAEKLHPRASDFDGSFHLAAGVLMGTMRTRGISVPTPTWPLD